MTNADRIREFHEAVGAKSPPRPSLPSAANLALRKTLIDEEYSEVSQAFARLIEAKTQPETSSLTELIHELTDLLYVTYGAIWACGVDADEVFAEVHAANMRKVSGPRRSDGKIMKPADWRPADVAAVLKRQSQL